MKVLNFGSLNIDYVYQVDHMVRAGETLASDGREAFPGGKGLNQSVALARAGVPVYHAGLIGDDGGMLLDVCRENGIDTRFIREMSGPSGHTIIQVDKTAQNCILLYAGSNGHMTPDFVDEVLSHFDRGDLLLLQNEINLLPYLIDRAYDRGMMVVLNPSPIGPALKECDLSKVSLFLLNEIEGSVLSGCDSPEGIMDYMRKTYPNARMVLTLGKDGSWYFDADTVLRQQAYTVDAVDTTAAGDTFTGYFLSALLKELPVAQALELASQASALAVTRKGAVPSIPLWDEVLAFAPQF